MIATVVAIGGLAAYGPSVASATTDLCAAGSGASQCLQPEDVAVDRLSGRFYVADLRNHRIDVFASTGQFLLAFGWGVADGTTAAPQSCGPAATPPTANCFKGLAGSGPGQFNRPRRVAVDNSGGATQGAVYVGSDNFRVQRFTPTGSFVLAVGWDVNKTKVGQGAPQAQRNVCTSASGDLCGSGIEGGADGQFGREDDPLTVGPGGVVYAGDLTSGGTPVRIEEFETSGAWFKTITLVGTRPLVDITVDSTGSIYFIYDGFGSFVRKIDPNGVPLYGLDENNQATSLAIDEANRVYVGEREVRDSQGSNYIPVATFDATGKALRKFGYGEFETNIAGLAPVPSSGGEVVAAAPGEDRVVRFGPPPLGPIVAPPSISVTGLSSTKAILHGEINAEGKPTQYHFEYVDQASYEVGGFANPATHSTALVSLGFEDFRIHHVQAPIGCSDPANEAQLPGSTCLVPGTQYHFRLVASNGDGAGDSLGVFQTRMAPDFVAEWSSGVGSDAARLSAELDPVGVPTTGYFEYVSDVSCQQDMEALGPAHCFDDAQKSPNVDGGADPLDFGSGEAPTVRSVQLSSLLPDTEYRFRIAASTPLLPAPAVGLDHTFTTFPKAAPPSSDCPGNESYRTGAGAFLPDCRAYEMVSPLDKNSGDVVARGEGTTGEPAALDRSASSGDKLAYGGYRAFGDAASSPYTSQYVATRFEGAEWRTHGISPPRTRLLLAVSRLADTELKALSPDLCQAWFRTVADPQLTSAGVLGFPNLYRRDNCEVASDTWQSVTSVTPPTVNASAYFALEFQGSSASGESAVYIANDKLTPDAPQLPSGALQLYAASGAQTRFLCILPNGAASGTACSAGMGGSTDGNSRAANLANAISRSGGRVFWTAAGPGGSGVGPGKIYVRENPFGSGPACSGGEAPCTKAVSQQGEALSGTSSSSFWGAAADGTVALFSTGGDLYEYDVDQGVTTAIAHQFVGFVGTGEDASEVYYVSTAAMGGANSQGEVAADGKRNLYRSEKGGAVTFIVTLSTADSNQDPPKGHTSTDATWPYKRSSRVTPDGEQIAFMSDRRLTGYDNADAVSGELDAEVYRYDAESDQLVCASCNPTGGRPVGGDISLRVKGSNFWAASWLGGWQNDLYSDGTLSVDGNRLFFESLDGLAPQDTNGHADVYQWEAPGTGDCSASSQSYSELNGGCVDLISSGLSGRDSEFRDASPSGHDVFLGTLANLLPQDYGLVDIYDARVDGGLPTPIQASPACEGDACQVAAPPPESPTPASLGYQGPGNLSGKRPHPCGRKKIRRHGHCVSKSKHRRHGSGRQGKRRVR